MKILLAAIKIDGRGSPWSSRPGVPQREVSCTFNCKGEESTETTEATDTATATAGKLERGARLGPKPLLLMLLYPWFPWPPWFNCSSR
jgi:hypothetical protein